MPKVPWRTPPSRRRPVLFGAAALVAVAVGAGLYGTARLAGNRDGCGPSRETLARLAPLARGEVAAFEPAKLAGRAPELGFDDPGGTPRRLADFAGRTVLLNLWATWCLPCRQEMPALDRLQAELGGPAFEVVAVNIDTRNPEKPRAWLAEAGVSRLAYYSDREAKIFQDLRRTGQAEGMPTTLLVDKRGCLLGRVSGPADWAGPDALALIRAALGGG